VEILLNRVFTKENTTSSLRKSSSPFFLQEFRPLTPLKATNRFTSLMVIGMMKIMCNNVIVEEHLVAFYNFAYNFNIDYADVWIRLFVQSLNGEGRKWFWGLPPSSIVDIEALEEAFIKQWGDKRDYLYYITEFGALKRKNGESISDFIERFNKMYGRIPYEIKPTEALCQYHLCQCI
jgi:hypothetical protein